MADPADDSSEPLEVFEWPPATAGLHFEGARIGGEPVDGARVLETLEGRVAGLADDRGVTAADLVRKVARETHGWLVGPDAPDVGIEGALDDELRTLIEAHSWRVPFARFVAALHGAALQGADGPSAPQYARREAMAAECARWFEDGAEAGASASHDAAEEPRLGSKERCADPLLTGPLAVTRGEVVLVHGWSETVARGLELARARGLEPAAIVSEGGADLGGRRLARRLSAGGMDVSFVYDAALVSALERADRVWIGSDAIGAHAFVARMGTRALVERASQLGVDVAVLATSDKFTHEARPALPRWAADEPWHLWEGAPASVTVESQAFELVPLDLVRAFATERGLGSAADVRARAAAPAESAAAPVTG
ncbi:MAG: hypothetical protein AAFP22_00595 [Planctomycetota bacterium]